MNNRVRYTRQNIISNSFYQLPKFLLDAELAGLTNDARVLYALLRNRHEISIKNEWFDTNGEVFLYFKREDMQNLLHLSDKTITKAMNALKEYSLLEEVKQGFSKPNMIYLLSTVPQSLGIEASATIPVNFTAMDERQENQHTRNIYDSIHGDFTTREPENLRVYKNHNKEIHNDINKNPVMSSQSESDGQDKDRTDDTAQQIEAYYSLIKENISYNDLSATRPYDMKLVDEFIAIIVDTVLTEGKTIWIGKEEKPRALVTSQLMKLTYNDIELVIDQFKSVTDRISKKKQYILTMLYNAKLEGDSHYTNLVKHDMWNGGGC